MWAWFLPKIFLLRNLNLPNVQVQMIVNMVTSAYKENVQIDVHQLDANQELSANKDNAIKNAIKRLLVNRDSIAMMNIVWTCADLQSALQIIIVKKGNVFLFKRNAQSTRTVKTDSSVLKELVLTSVF